MDETQRQARQQSYALLARLFLAEIDPPLLAYLDGLPGLGEGLPVASGPAMDRWLEEAAAEYHQLFGLNLYPYASIFLDPSVLLNTEGAQQVARFYQTCGFVPPTAHKVPADHLGLELQCMAHLIEQERHAHLHHDQRGVRWCQQQQAHWLHTHLAAWVPLCMQTLQRLESSRHPVTVGDPTPPARAAASLYAHAATLTTALLLSDLALIPAPDVPGEHLPCATVAPSPPAFAEPPGIHEIVQRLITPAWTGVLLSRADMAHLARAQALPSAFGERAHMLRTLFESASAVDQLGSLLQGLHALWTQAHTATQTLTQQYSAWAPHGEGWQQRQAQTLQMLTMMEADTRA